MGVGCRSYLVPQVKSGTCDPGARGAEERKVVDEVTRVEPTHGARECGIPHARPPSGGTRVSNLLQDLRDPAKGRKEATV
jgi:hypothetical protein